MDPLNSPPPRKLNLSVTAPQQSRERLSINGYSMPITCRLMPFTNESCFTEVAAARFAKLTKVSSSQSLVAAAGFNQGLSDSGNEIQLEGEFFGNAQEESSSVSVSDRIVTGSASNGRKRRTTLKSKGKMVEDLNAKRCKMQGKEYTNSKLPEPPKDFIHVRARRGQATDSHSIAERVRRGKISERMKFLQDLVPSCNKVTSKALMLEEIINYVQSLQCQVEFLSMKLSAANPWMNQACGSTLSCWGYPLEATSMALSYAHRPTDVLETQYSGGVQSPLFNGFGDGTSQPVTLWENDLQTVVQMGFFQNQDTEFSSQSFSGGRLGYHEN